MSKQNLIDAWTNWRPFKTPYVLKEDIKVLREPANERHISFFNNWKSYYLAQNFDNPNQRGVHLGLLPQPYCGDLEKAEIYILLLNPGLHPTDYYGEYEVSEFRKAALDNLNQKGNKKYPFIYLNPEFSWHGGYDWWHGKLSSVIAELAKEKGISYAAARQLLSKKIASIELFPYHSKSFSNHAWIIQLESVKLAREYVHSHVLPKAHAGKAVVIVTRQVKTWGIDVGRGVELYGPGEARKASLGPKSKGGKAILSRFR